MRLRYAPFILSMLLAPPALAETIRFPAFGYSVDVPDGLARCEPFDNGVAFYLDGKSQEPACGAKPDRRMMIVSAEGNDELPGADSFAAQQCDYLQDRWKSFPPDLAKAQKYSVMMPVPSLEIGHRASWSCLFSSDDGEDLFVTTQCVSPSQQPYQIEIDCGVWLHTRNYERDLPLFRKIIASVEFFVPVASEFPPIKMISTAGSCPSQPPRVPQGKPYKLKDPRSGLTLELADDGRHIEAVDAAGNVVWKKNPFVDAHLQPYRQPHPVIVRIGVIADCAIDPLKDSRAHDHFISVRFSSSQFGMLDAKTGDFIFMGQN